MKKQFKAIIVVLIALVMLVLCFGCTKSTAPTESPTPSESETPSKEIILPKVGSTVKFFWYSVGSDENENPWTKSETSTGKIMRDRITDIEEEYSITIDWLNMSDIGDFTTVSAAAAANSPTCDIMHGGGPHVFIMGYKAGGYAAISDYADQFDFSDEAYFNQVYQNDLMSVDGKVYGVSPHRVGLNSVDYKVVGFFNKEILQNQAGVDPSELYAHVKNGTWTFEKFKEYAKKGTKKTDDAFDIAGIRLSRGLFSTTMVYANGGSLIDEREGKLVFTGNEKEAVAAYQFIKGLYEDGSLEMIPGTDGETDIADFKKGKVLFVYHNANRNNNLVGEKPMPDPFGIIIAPKGPDATDYFNEANFFDLYHLMKSIEDPNGAVLVLGRIIQPIYAKGEDTALFDAEITTYVDSADDIDMYKLILEKSQYVKYITYNYVGDYLMFNVLYDFESKFYNGEEAIQAHMDSIKPSIDDLIDTVMTS